MTSATDMDDLPPLDRAIAVLGDRVWKRKNGAYILDDIPVNNSEIITAANIKLLHDGKQPIFYPGVWPRPDPQRPKPPPEPKPEEREDDAPPVRAIGRPIRAGAWTFFSSPALQETAVYPPWEELEQLQTHLNRLVADNSPENWDAANAHLDLTFKKVCQFMRDRTPQRIEEAPAQPAGEEART